MEQKSKYEIEIENFRKIFDDKKNMRIAIYGIGRRTATLLPGITDYNITGLLDRDKNNVGKELCDIKVIPIDNIEEKADLIIINSDPSNYEIIFKRISGKVTIPVYYADGRLACLSDKDKSYEQNEYWKSSYEELKDKIDQADIVSFDIFDTLIMRKIFSPEDVFRLLGEKVKAELKSDCNIADIRAQVAAKCGPFATINEIYEKIKKQIDLTDKNMSDIMQLEKKTDMDLCIARKDIAELYEYCIESGKEVYLISDMYYTLQDIKRLLDKCGLSVIDDRHIWISCEKKKDKISGSLWKEYSSVVGKNAKCIHIGDNKIGDIENSTKYGINSYYVMSGQEAKAERENYIKYLEIDGDMQKDLTYGTVDLGYYGTNQYYLQRLTNIKTKGYCFYACLSKDNVYMNDISVDTCFQYGDDYTAEKSLVRKKNMYIETFITAPQGMIRYIDNHGGMVCESDRKSQKYFHIKEKVNCGVVNFIRDYINIYKGVLAVNSEEYIKLMHDRKESLEDNLFYNMLNSMCNISKDILKGFYFDNDFVGGKEIMVEI